MGMGKAKGDKGMGMGKGIVGKLQAAALLEVRS